MIETMDKLDLSLVKLNKCQEMHNITCYKCINTFVCNIRSNYVKEVYLSMHPNLDNKDEGFNF